MTESGGAAVEGRDQGPAEAATAVGDATLATWRGGLTAASGIAAAVEVVTRGVEIRAAGVGATEHGATTRAHAATTETGPVTARATATDRPSVGTSTTTAVGRATAAAPIHIIRMVEGIRAGHARVPTTRKTTSSITITTREMNRP